MTFDVRAFRHALGSFPTGVAVVTTSASAEHHMGITVNSFTSVSLDPPLVLWCLDKKSDRYHAFTKATKLHRQHSWYGSSGGLVAAGQAGQSQPRRHRRSMPPNSDRPRSPMRSQCSSVKPKRCTTPATTRF